MAAAMKMTPAMKLPSDVEIIQMHIRTLLSDATEVTTAHNLDYFVVIDGEGQFMDQVRVHKAWKEDPYFESFCIMGIHLPFLVHFTLGHGDTKGQELVGEITATIQKHYPDAVFDMDRGWNANWIGKTGKDFIEYVNKNQPGNTVSAYSVRPSENTVTVYYEIVCPQGCKDTMGKMRMCKAEDKLPLGDNNQEAYALYARMKKGWVNVPIESTYVLPKEDTAPPRAKTLREELDATHAIITSPFWAELKEGITDHLRKHWGGASKAIPNFPIGGFCAKYPMNGSVTQWEKVYWQLNMDPSFDTFIFSHHDQRLEIVIRVKE